MIELLHGDALDVLASRRAEAEAVVCDPPCGVSFMGLRFDTDHGGDGRWIEHMAPRFAAMREACIPGAYGLFWALPRTQDWTMQALRRAGWHVVDVLAHFFGQGWPKGRGQLKPAQEAWILVRDPRGKVRPLNIDACRVRRSWAERPESWFRSGNSAKPDAEKISGAPAGNGIHAHEGGSWPPNLLLSHAPACCRVGARKVGNGEPNTNRARQSQSQIYGADTGRQNALRSFGECEIPAWECLAVCSCGLASLAPAGGAPTPCSCGEERWWCCPVAELDAQSDGCSRFFPTFQNGSRDTYCPACLDVSLRGGTSASLKAGGIESGASRGAESSTSSLSTDGCGSGHTDPSRPDMKSTTRTRTRPTTGSKTSSASRRPSTTRSTPSNCPTCGSPMVSRSGAVASATPGSQLASSFGEPQERSTGTAKHAASLSSGNGEPRTLTTERLIAERERRSVYQPSFVYDAKAARAERQAGCEGLLWVRDDAAPIGWRRVSAEEHAAAPEKDRREGNVHATIKPIGCGQDDGLMRWLVRLVTPEGGPVLDGMMGSGSTGVAAQIEGRAFIGCDIDPGAVDIARARLAFWTPDRHRLALRDAEALRAEQARERAAREAPRLDDLGPLFAGRAP